jgi:hypothetical protein
MAQKRSNSADKTPRSVGGYRVLGRTRDGVLILEPKGKPQSFTVTELKKAIRAARAGKAA